jgi:Ferritin-like domain
VTLSRAGFLAVAGGSALGGFAGVARADVYGDNDLAYLRLLTAVELLGADFYGNATKARPYDRPGQALLTRAAFNEHEHYGSLAGFLTASGQTPATAEDIDFTYPRGTYASTGAVTKTAVALETIFLGAYLGAVAGVDNASLKQPLARIAASQAEHLAVFTALLGRNSFELSFPVPLTIDEASNALDAYTS